MAQTNAEEGWMSEKTVEEQLDEIILAIKKGDYGRLTNLKIEVKFVREDDE